MLLWHSADSLENYITQLKEEGENLKAFIYCNPSNPLGDIYDGETTLNLMRVCKKHQIHFISDEIYALSIFDPQAKLKFKRQVIVFMTYYHGLWKSKKY